MVNRFLKIIFLALIYISLTPAQNIKVTAGTDSAQYFVGDYIYYTLKIIHDKNVTIQTYPVRDSLKGLEFIAESKPVITEGNGQVSETIKYILSKYDSAEVTIPPQTVGYKIPGNDNLLKAESNPVTILVTTVPVEQKADIKDVKEPVRIPFNWLIALIILWVILFLTGIFFIVKIFWWDKRKAKSVEQVIIKIPPYEEALKSLHMLEDKKLWQAGQVKEYHSEVTEIIRKYFEGRFNIAALEMTSAEIMNALKRKRETKEIYDATNEFFVNADMVKFAKFLPMASVNEEMMKQAYKIVDVTKQRIAEATEKAEAVNV